ncbi:hypothetical protein EHO61_03645 [Leptospira fluminis]|uniref:Uncharacterized protein n=1 Tax=Leptospira fluminis TaxID=2484979 RepID=A0A4R9GS81_9LEPT|nr:hypothetical protein [Leptospira fluminis]TGK20961.1 hypothetical protein EHO61_03645 [Leptospira fluminis]
MGLCQPDSNVPFSCGACCGLFNLDASPDRFRELLDQRTREFKATVDFTRPYTMAEFRKSREEQEKEIPRKDPLTYNCPFLGKLSEDFSESDNKPVKAKTRIGCMIHPIYSGDARSQNYSFYGASICQAYDCRNKERNNSEEWEKVFSELADDSFSYSALASDYRTVDLIEGYLREKRIPESEWFTSQRNRILKLLRRKFQNGIALWNTSFELEMESPPPVTFEERLAVWFGTDKEDLPVS